MSIIQKCEDTKDTLDLYRGQGLYLKPVAKLNISVQLPQLKKSGAKISNWEVMEKAKEMAKPHSFPVFKVAKSSLEFIRFEAEIENYGAMETVLAKLDMKTIKLSGFTELLKIRAAEAKPVFPTRHDWDSFFRNNKHMNEMKPGERPDTIYLKNLPTKWFFDQKSRDGVAKDKPSEYVLKKVFATFGEIRAIDIPLLDPYRQLMKSSISGIQTFNFEQDLVFDAYIQFKEYVGFVKAMNSLKGMKLCFKDRYEDKAWVANIKVDFEKTKHLAESTIKKREEERKLVAAKEREREDAERRKRDLDELKRSQELRKMAEEDRERERKVHAEKALKIERRMEREQRRRQAKAGTKNATGEEAMAEKIAVEERKLVIAQRRLESIRLLDELLDRVKVVKSKEKKVSSLEEVLLKTAAKQAAARKAGKGTADGGKTGNSTPVMTYKDKDEQMLRDKLINRLKEKEVSKMAMVGLRLRNAKENNRFDSDDEGAGMSVEDISEDDLEDQDEDREETSFDATREDNDNNDNDKLYSDIDENGGAQEQDEDLRLTSTDEDGDEDDREGDALSPPPLPTPVCPAAESKDSRSSSRNSSRSPKHKKSKKDKHRSSKKSKKEKKKKRDRSSRSRSRSGSRSRSRSRSRNRSRNRSRDRKEDDAARKRREIASHIAQAKKISDREKRERQRDEEGDERKRKDESNRFKQYNERVKDGYPDYRTKMADARAQERLLKMQAEKAQEMKKEELYDRMMNPHMYRLGASRSPTPPPDALRKVRRGEHYEDVQKEYLQNELRIKERRERRLMEERENRNRERENRNRDPRGRDMRGREDYYDANRGREDYSRDRDYRGGGGGMRAFRDDDRMNRSRSRERYSRERMRR